MSDCRIRAGRPSEVKLQGQWIFVDLGFSSSKPSTGYLHITDAQNWTEAQALSASKNLPVKKRTEKNKAWNIPFGEACHRIAEAAKQSNGVLNLVLEAPLSGALNAGNPVERCDIEGNERRWWYVQPGPVVTMAALYLLDKLLEPAEISGKIRLFEGFVSFKQGQATDHRQDVCSLAAAVRDHDGKCVKVLNKKTAWFPFLRGATLEVPPVILVHPDFPRGTVLTPCE